MTRRFPAALTLFLLSPFVAEYLLGDFTVRQWQFYFFMAPIYGGGAVIIREFARRTGRGWPTMLTLGLAYGLIEEGLCTQSLFNPNYLGLHLLKYGFIPALGVSGPWTISVMAIHVFWSMAVPIALTEALFAAERQTPWLGTVGLSVFTLIYLVGALLIRTGTARMDKFMARPPALVTIAAAAIIVAAAAFLLFRPGAGSAPAPHSPRPWLVGASAFVAGSLLLFGNICAPATVPPWVDVLLMLLLIALFLGWLGAQSRAADWTPAHTAAAAIGGALVYCWWGFLISASLHAGRVWPLQCISAAIMLALLAPLAARRPVSAS